VADIGAAAIAVEEHADTEAAGAGAAAGTVGPRQPEENGTVEVTMADCGTVARAI